MAIFSLHHSVIGKATQKRPETAAAHVRYITRDSACSGSIGARLPDKPKALARWFCTQESQDRANARVCDKLMLALPRELDAEQRRALIREFAETVTRERAPWFAAFHDKGKDVGNPHCHLIIRDRDLATGKRVIQTTERGSTERLREAWEAVCNRHLERAQQQARVSRLSLRARGLDRKPTIHEGARARHLAGKKLPVRSRPVNARNAVTARSRARQIDYPTIDQSRSRTAYNAAIVLQNERIYWAAIDADAARRQATALTQAAAVKPVRPGFDREAWLAREQAGRQHILSRDDDD